MNELAYQHAFIAAVPYHLPARLYQRNIINVKTEFGARVRNGIKGQADIECIVFGGLHIEIEAKAIDGRLKPQQKKWQAFCLKNDIPHLVVRVAPNETPAQTIARWIEELRTCIESRQK